MKNIIPTDVVRLCVGLVFLLMAGLPVSSLADDDEGTYKPQGIGSPSGRVGGGSRGYNATMPSQWY